MDKPEIHELCSGFFFIETFQSFAHSSFETRRKSIH